MAARSEAEGSRLAGVVDTEGHVQLGWVDTEIRPESGQDFVIRMEERG